MEIDTEKIKHLWNATRMMLRVKGCEANNLRIHYIDCCRAVDKWMELPKQQFGPSIMCSHCGSLWASVDHKIRIARGRKPSKSILKLIRSSECGNRRVSRYRTTLMNKCIKNQMNKMIITCSICSMNTTIAFNKPERKKVPKSDAIEPATPILPRKKKKKRTKDKTAGLNISINGTSSSKVSASVQISNANAVTPINRVKKVTATSISKKKNSNMLKGVIKKSITPSTKSSLRHFLKDLC